MEKLFLAIIVAFVVVFGLSVFSQYSKGMPEYTEGGKVLSRTNVGGSFIYTVEHDGYKFIYNYNGGVIRHPECEGSK